MKIHEGPIGQRAAPMNVGSGTAPRRHNEEGDTMLKQIVVALIGAFALSISYAQTSDVQKDTRDIRQDRRDIRQDKQERRQDRREARKDAKAGDVQGARAERREARQETRDIHQDRRDLRQDKKDRRKDVKAAASKQ
jgi:hypothetical protein